MAASGATGRATAPSGMGSIAATRPASTRSHGSSTTSRRNPASRRLMFTGWNVAELDEMALPPCHTTYQYFVADGRLSGLLHQRSCDVGLGLPYNLVDCRAPHPHAGAAMRSRAGPSRLAWRRRPPLRDPWRPRRDPARARAEGMAQARASRESRPQSTTTGSRISWSRATILILRSPHRSRFEASSR